GFLQVLTNGAEQRWLGSAPKGTSPRVALANWITDAEGGAGHLLARVIVNRLWQHHFGRGLVATPSDFGTRGDRPSNQALLDYLAVELMRNGWHLKPIHRLILISETYRLSSDNAESRASEVDPDNRH